VCASSKDGRSIARERCAPQLTLGALLELQDMELVVAARRFKLGTTQFKLQCRSLGVTRWPFRTLKSLQRLITSCATKREETLCSTRQDTLRVWEDSLRAVKVRRAA
jgi:hypothetical protein